MINDTSPGIADIIHATLAANPNAVMAVDGRQSWTRQDIYDRARHLGAALAGQGLQPGSVVAFQLPNWAEACVINLACVLHGYVVTPLLLMYREHELGSLLTRTQADAIFIPKTFRGTDFPALLANTELPDRQRLRLFTVRAAEDPSQPSYEALLAETADTPDLPHIPLADLKSITFTSGSTGRAKGVLHTHETMLSTTKRCAAFWSLDEHDRMLVPSPIGHIGGSLYAFELPWITGASALLMESWDPLVAVELINAQGLTFCAGATPFLQGLLDTAKEAGSRLTSLRRFICGGASVSHALVRAAAGQFENAVISRAYGSTEIPLVSPGTRTRADAHYGETTDGQIDVELRLEDVDRNPADGPEGDILARSAGMFTGYLDPEDGADAFTPDRFFRMGDIGRIVDGKFLEITGRRKEIIIRNGENISPLEIENVLCQSPAIDRVAVVGIPNAKTGERAVAFVTLNPGHDLTLDSMRSFLIAAGLARQKMPEELHIVPAIPLTAVGKVMKPELRRIAIESAAAGKA
jgi:acyl-CoA synthetase (AMP-forming)/AMP-acid ligase II